MQLETNQDEYWLQCYQVTNEDDANDTNISSNTKKCIQLLFQSSFGSCASLFSLAFVSIPDTHYVGGSSLNLESISLSRKIDVLLISIASSNEVLVRNEFSIFSFFIVSKYLS
jgi:hypothetical protein